MDKIIVKEFELTQEVLGARDSLHYAKLLGKELSLYEEMFLELVNKMLGSTFTPREPLEEDVKQALADAEEYLAKCFPKYRKK